MITGNQVDRHSQGLEAAPQLLVVFRPALVDKVAGCQHHIWQWIQFHNLIDRSRERRRGVSDTVAEVAHWPRMSVI